MAKKEDRKKQKKRLKEKKKATERRRHLEAQAQAARYPRIIVNPAGGDPAFVGVVSEIVKTFSFDDPQCCDDTTRANYASIADVGMKGWVRHFAGEIAQVSSTPQEARLRHEYQLVTMYSHFGEWLFAQLPMGLKSSFSLDTFFRVHLDDTGIGIHFTLLESVGEPANPLYLPPDAPKVVMQGAKWQVGLYRHALERICSRITGGRETTYAGYNDIYFRLHQKCFAYEPVILHGGQEALRVDFQLPVTNHCFKYYAEYARKILGLPADHPFSDADRLYAVAGYLPLQIQGKYARAKTFLLPGFAKTPEYALARSNATTPEERMLLRDMTDEERRTGDLDGWTVEAIRWYHENGVPQVFYRDAAGGP